MSTKHARRILEGDDPKNVLNDLMDETDEVGSDKDDQETADGGEYDDKTGGEEQPVEEQDENGDEDEENGDEEEEGEGENGEDEDEDEDEDEEGGEEDEDEEEAEELLNKLANGYSLTEQEQEDIADLIAKLDDENKAMGIVDRIRQNEPITERQELALRSITV